MTLGSTGITYSFDTFPQHMCPYACVTRMSTLPYRCFEHTMYESSILGARTSPNMIVSSSHRNVAA
jgi:hypothetical protein